MDNNISREQKLIVSIGLFSIVIWLLYLMYIPPFTKYPAITDPSLQSAVVGAFVKAYATITIGVLGGVLLLFKKRAGKFIIIAISVYMIAGRILAAFSDKDGFFMWVHKIYGDLLFRSPLAITHKDIIAPLLFIISIMVLLNKNISRILK